MCTFRIGNIKCFKENLFFLTKSYDFYLKRKFNFLKFYIYSAMSFGNKPIGL